MPDNGWFVEVTKVYIISDLDFDYKFTPGSEMDQPGTFLLIDPHHFYSENKTYQWNGDAFVLKDRKVDLPLDEVRFLLSQKISLAMRDGQFKEIRYYREMDVSVAAGE